MKKTKRAGEEHQLLNQETPTHIYNIPPKPLNLNTDKIPEELKQLTQWVLFKLEYKVDKETGEVLKHEKPEKVPYQPDGKLASSSNKRHWNRFETVIQALNTGNFHGISFVFSKEDDYTGLDFDDCINEHGVIEPARLKDIQTFDSYTEKSLSGTGVHIIIRGSLRELSANKTGNKKNNMEVYDNTKFFCFTGEHLEGTPKQINERQPELNQWFRDLFGTARNVLNFPNRANNNTAIYSDDDVIQRCVRKYGSRFTSLFYEGYSDRFDDESSCDMSLLNFICQYTQNIEQVERIFMESALYLNKDDYHLKKWERDNYRLTTIQKVIDSIINYRINHSFHDEPEPEQPIYDEYIELLRNTSYSLNERGTLCEVKQVLDKKTNEVTTVLNPLCNFVSKVSHEITEDDGQEQIKKFRIEGVREGGQPFEPVVIHTKDFESMSWVVANWGTRANIQPVTKAKDKVRFIIQECSENRKDEHLYTHLGFRNINGEWVYLHSGGAIGSELVKVNLEQHNLSAYRLPEPSENLVESIKTSIGFMDVAEPFVSLPLLAMVGLSPLCEPFRQHKNEPAFVMWLTGGSGAGKSTITGLLMNHFGEFSGTSLPANFKDTFNALEKKSFLVKDSVLCIDDYHPHSNLMESRIMEGKAEDILRGYGNRAGKDRMKQDTSTRKGYVPRGLCIVSGETTPISSTSGTARMFLIELDKKSIFIEQVKRFSTPENLLRLRESYRGYIEWLLPKMDELSEKLHTRFNAHYSFTHDMGNQHGRLKNTITWLYIGLEQYLRYALEHGAITKKEGLEILEKAIKEFRNISFKQAETLFEEEKSEQFLRVLKELLNTGKIRIEHIEGEMSGDVLGASEGSHIGYYDDDYIYLYSETVIGEVELFLKRQNKVLGCSQKTLLKQLAEKNYIQKHFEKTKNGTIERNTGKKKIRKLKTTGNFMWLRKSILIEEEPIENSENEFI